MVNYQYGKIYRVDNFDNDSIWVAATCTPLPKKRYELAQKGFHNIHLVLIEHYPCNSKDELNARLDYWKSKIDRQQKEEDSKLPPASIEFREKNREIMRQYHHKYHKKYYEENREQILEYKKKCYQDEKEARAVPVQCQCGGTYRRDNKSHHVRAKQHLIFLDDNTPDQRSSTLSTQSLNLSGQPTNET